MSRFMYGRLHAIFLLKVYRIWITFRDDLELIFKHGKEPKHLSVVKKNSTFAIHHAIHPYKQVQII